MFTNEVSVLTHERGHIQLLARRCNILNTQMDS